MYPIANTNCESIQQGFFASFLNNLDVFQQQPTVQLNTINGTLVNVPLCNETGIRCADDCLTLLV